MSLAAIIFLGASCTNTNNTTTTLSQPVINANTSANTITIENFSFKPDVLNVKIGDIVIWRQDDSAVHTIVSYNLFESPTLNRGDEFVYAFQTAGEYDYHCGIHPSMKGKIIVQ